MESAQRNSAPSSVGTKPWDQARRGRVPIWLLPLAVIFFYPWLAGFDLSRHSVPSEEILSGGPPKDGIPAITKPEMVPAGKAPFLGSDDLVVGIVVGGQARAYPLRILNWHEVVDDSVGGTPVVVTYCPLTASGIVYKRSLRGKELTLGVSGQLYQSNLLFYDRQTESLWSQIQGQALTGAMTGSRLVPLLSTVTTWKAWRGAHPNTLVLSNETGYPRDYSVNPYQNYERSPELLFPVVRVDSRLPAKERVMGIVIGKASEAFAFSRMAAVKTPINVFLAASHIQVLFDSSSQSAGARRAGKELLVFTGYWFAWAAFHPDTKIWSPESGPQAGGAEAGSAARAATGTSGTPQSGIYGKAGVGSEMGGFRGIEGECVWVLDSTSQTQTAIATCSAGRFRLALPPGRYLLKGPGGRQIVEVRKNDFTYVSSIVAVSRLP